VNYPLQILTPNAENPLLSHFIRSIVDKHAQWIGFSRSVEGAMFHSAPITPKGE